MKRALNIFWYLTVTLLAVEFLWLVLPVPPQWVEWYYTSGLFAAIITPLVAIHQIIPVSMSAVVLLIIIPCFLVLAAIGLRRARKRNVAWRVIAWAGFQCVAVVFVLVYGWFLVTFGVGYRREAIELRLDLAEADRVTRADLDATMDEMLAIISANLEKPEVRDEANALRSIRNAMGDLAKEWDGHRPPLPDDVKRLPGGMLVFLGAYGVNSPYFMEPHVDGALPSHAVVSTGAHELAHVAGFSGEADATLAGLLAGLRADHPYARYASALAAYANLCAELGPEAQRARFEALPEDALNDLRAEADIYQRYTRNVTTSVFQPMYHSYLVTQGVSEGIEDYSRGSRMFVNAWRKGLAETSDQDGG
jgi:hypothetical protein